MRESMRLHEAAKALALERGTRCPVCDGQGEWSQEISAVVCPKCWDGDLAKIVSTRWVPRAAVCGEKSIAGTGGVKLRVSGRRRDGTLRAKFDGVYYCNKPWQCPRCASRTAFSDSRTLHAANMGWRGFEWDAAHGKWRLPNRRIAKPKLGKVDPKTNDHAAPAARRITRPRHSAYLLSCTLPHHRRQALEPMRRAVTTAFSRCINGKGWKLVKKAYGIRASVRALEVNHGGAGWHAHIHAVLLTDRPLSAAARSSLANWFWARWSMYIVRAGYRCPSRQHGVDLIAADRAGRYLAKMGLAELAGDRAKLGRCPRCSEYKGTAWEGLRRRCVDCGAEVNRTMWQVLEDIADHGAEHDRRLWRVWCAEIRGARRLTWSRDKIADEKTVRELYADYIRIPEQAPCECRGLDPKCERGCIRGRYTRHRLRRAPPQLDLEIEKIETMNVHHHIWEYAKRSADLRVSLLEAFEAQDKYALEALMGEWMPKIELAADPDAEPQECAEEHTGVFARFRRWMDPASLAAMTPAEIAAIREARGHN